MPAALFGDWQSKDWHYFDALALVVRSNVLTFGQFPVHDPWVGGGLDILANPQSRVFSPMGLLDLLFAPHTANFVSFAIYGVIGACGMFLLLRKRMVSARCAVLGAGLFANGSYFALHFAEGHVPYGAFQLLPWVLLFALDLQQRKNLFLLALTLSIFLLDGAFYAFVFSCYLVLNALVIAGAAQFKATLAYWFKDIRNFAFLVLVALGCAFLILPKIYPLLALQAGRPPEHVYATLHWHLGKILFWPLQNVFDSFPRKSWRFHEYGNYIGITAAAVVCFAAARVPGFLKSVRAPLLSCLFWIWVAAAWLRPLNPWTLHELIPMFNKCHVQSRVLILAFLFFIIALAQALTRLEQRAQLKSQKTLLFCLGLFLLCEYSFVNQYVWANFITSVENRTPPLDVMQKTERGIVETIFNGHKANHYLLNSFGARVTYEPAGVNTQVLPSGSSMYKGEAYLLQGLGKVSLISYHPAAMHLAFQAPPGSVIEVNTNHLLGWQVVKGDAQVVSQAPNDLLKLQITGPAGSGKSEGVIEVHYRPKYLSFIPYSLLAGCGILSAAFSLGVLRPRRRMKSTGAFST